MLRCGTASSGTTAYGTSSSSTKFRCDLSSSNQMILSRCGNWQTCLVPGVSGRTGEGHGDWSGTHLPISSQLPEGHSRLSGRRRMYYCCDISLSVPPHAVWRWARLKWRSAETPLRAFELVKSVVCPQGARDVTQVFCKHGIVSRNVCVHTKITENTSAYPRPVPLPQK